MLKVGKKVMLIMDLDDCENLLWNYCVNSINILQWCLAQGSQCHIGTDHERQYILYQPLNR